MSTQYNETQLELSIDPEQLPQIYHLSNDILLAILSGTDVRALEALPPGSIGGLSHLALYLASYHVEVFSRLKRDIKEEQEADGKDQAIH